MRILVLLLMLSVASPVRAQTLYDDLGGEAAVARIVSGMIDRAIVDPRIADTFANSNLERLRKVVALHVCAITGGPCTYTRPLKPSHVQLGLTDAHFNALVENLQASMDAEGIPFHRQNRLLAILAPMHRDVVTR